MRSTSTKIWYILLIGFVLRILTVMYFADLDNDYYWEYGEIAKNIIYGKGYSLWYIDDGILEHHFNPQMNSSASAYMPPGYVFFLLPFLLIKDLILRNILLYLIQILISLATIYLCYLLTLKLFSEKIATISALIIAVLPEFIYAVLSASPTIIYHLLVLSILIIMLNSGPKTKNVIILSFLVALTIYFRLEFILFFLMFLFLLVIQKKYKFAFSIFFIVITLILPWSVRNYFTFNEWIPLSTNFGLNLYRGNNPHGIGSWGDDEIKNRISSLNNSNLEVKIDNIYKDEVLSYIKENPFEVLKNMFVKLFYLWFFYPNDQRSYNYLYLLPTLFISLFFIIGFLFSLDWNKYKYIYLFFIYSSIVVMIFFPMIRYQTMMKIAMIPFCAFGIFSLVKFFKQREK